MDRAHREADPAPQAGRRTGERTQRLSDAAVLLVAVLCLALICVEIGGNVAAELRRAPGSAQGAVAQPAATRVLPPVPTAPAAATRPPAPPTSIVTAQPGGTPTPPVHDEG